MTQEQRDGLNDAALALTEPIIDELLKDISRRIKMAGAITDTAEYEIYRAQALGESKRAIAQAIARQTEINAEVIDALLDYVVDASARFEDDAYLQQLTEGYAEVMKTRTAEHLKDLWATTPDGKTVPLQDAYARALDFAFRQTATGSLDLNTAIRRAVGPLARRGLRTIEQKNGRSVGIEYACRRYLMDQMGALDNAIQQQNHDRMGCDGWEISAHAACAPDHEPIQGRQYTDAEFEALNASLQRPIGRLNCRHVADPVLIGVDKPVYRDAELAQMAADNKAGVTYNGKHYTLYGAGQEQATLENAIRRMRRMVLMDEESGSADLQKNQIRLRVLQSEYSQFCRATGRRTRTERLYTAGFGRSQAGKAVWTYRRESSKGHLTSPSSNAIISPIRTAEEVEALSVRADAILKKHLDIPSKWSGRTIVETSQSMPKNYGEKRWNCDIALRTDADGGTAIHEHLHARSGSFYSPEIYRENQRMEEGSVEFLTTEICKSEQIDHATSVAYKKYVDGLRTINQYLQIGDDLEFAKKLLGIPLPERFTWLRDKVSAYLSDAADLSSAERMALDSLIEQYWGSI